MDTPSRGIQVFYDSTPPEALIIKPEETATSPHSFIATSNPKRRNNHLLFIIVLVILAIALALGLGLGLGLGLRQQTNQGTKASTTVSADSGIANTPIQQVKLRGIMTNTSFTALAFPDGQRFIYFQETTGALRRATFDPTNEVWGVSTDTRLDADARNNTPLAGVVYPSRLCACYRVRYNKSADLPLGSDPLLCQPEQ